MSVCRTVLSCTLAVLAAQPSSGGGPHQERSPSAPGFVETREGSFRLNGAPFNYGGTNIYYLHVESEYMVDSALEHAAANNFTVVRMWAFSDADSCATASGVFYQCRADDGTIRIANETLTRIDYVLAKAATLGLRVVMTFTNNWKVRRDD